MRSFAIGLTLALSLGAASAAQEIGAVGAVNPATVGEPPAAAARQLRIADRVVRNERIFAGPDGLAQIMLADQTTVTVGPNSEIVLDDFIYDPAADSGRIALTLTRGALRFIGGRTSKSEAAAIRAPGGVVFVRGGLATVDTDPARTRIVLWAGDNATIEAGDQRLVLARPGAAAVIEGLDGGAPALRYIGVIDAAGAGGLIGAFRSPGDGGLRGTGGAPEPGVLMADGGASAQPVSTVGQLALVEEPTDAAFDGRLFDRLTTAPIFGREVSPDGGDFVDVGGMGAVRGQLVWNNASDLDLYLDLPGDAGRVAFFNRTVTFNGGLATARLDADNLGGVINVQPDLRVENIVVTGQLPSGDYSFFVNGFSVRVPGSSPFSLTVTGDGGLTSRTVRGSVSTGQNSPPVVVTVPPGGS